MKFRDRQRAKGLRPANVWIPDIPAYRARLQAACRELAALPPAEAEADSAAGLVDAFNYTPGASAAGYCQQLQRLPVIDGFQFSGLRAQRDRTYLHRF
jgi:hypothetical protein